MNQRAICIKIFGRSTIIGWTHIALPNCRKPDRLEPGFLIGH